MKDWKLTSLEWLFLTGCVVAWLGVLLLLPPSLGGTDVYLFRDAAYNLLAGQGFRTASFEHSRSFSPLLYSSYTPGTLWAFAGVVKLLGHARLTVRFYPQLWALIGDLFVLFAGIRFLRPGSLRWIFLLLFGLVLPFGFLGPMGERPEAVSFVVLALLVLAMRTRPAIASAGFAGLLGGVAFLCQPFAGVVAVFLIAGWLFCSGLGENAGGSFARFLARSGVAALMFVLPVAITAAAFYQRDSQSLQRFWQQATVAGLGRQASYSAGEPVATQAKPAAPLRPSKLEKYRDALAFHRSLGPIHLADLAGSAAIGLAWLLLLLTSRGPWPGRLALLLAGLVCFVLPVVVFPLQGNYLALTRVVFSLLLAANWASVRASLRAPAVIPVLLAISAVAALPASGITLLTGWEERASYRLALQQVETLRAYLEGHPLHGKVVLAPHTHYYLYKDVAGNLYNPDYLSGHEDAAQVGAVVNCYTATADFKPGTLPLPEFVATRQWERIATAQDTVVISLLGHKVMSRNWGLGCDIYVPPTH